MTPEKGIFNLGCVVLVIFIISYVLMNQVLFMIGYFIFTFGLLVVAYYCKD